MSNAILFDSSTLISIATNNLLWVLPELKKRFNGRFFITSAVKKEIVQVPLRSRRFKLEAVQIVSLIAHGVLEICESKKYAQKTQQVLDETNIIFNCKGNAIKIVHPGEIESLIIARDLGAVLAMDERTTRLLLEAPQELHRVMEQKLHCSVPMKLSQLQAFQRQFKGVSVIRSTELMVMAYELGILDEYLEGTKPLLKEDPKETLLDGLLWGLRLRGCAISTSEINQLKKLAAHA